MTEPKRPALRYHGGKWLVAPRIIALFPPHRTYVEPFGGAASVLIRKPRSYAEIYNDLDQEVVGYFKVLRDPVQRAALLNRLALTPFAREEFNGAYEKTDDPIERAARLVIRSFMGFGSDGHNDCGQHRVQSEQQSRSGTTPAHDWANLPPHIGAIGERFTGVVIENRPALKVMAQHDTDETLHYVDPPYLPETRSIKSRRRGQGFKAYRHEMTAEQHGELLEALLGLRGSVVLSGYASPLYDTALRDWRRTEFEAMADGARPRLEVVWMNPQAVRLLNREGPLFGDPLVMEWRP